MVKGKVRAGSDADSLLRWDQDALKDCSAEDQIWGWSIRSTEVLHHDRIKINDSCLIEMLYAGLLNKQDGAPAWTEPTSIKYGIRLVMNQVIRVIQKIFKVEDKVATSQTLVFWYKLTSMLPR